jgi:hypothetical protein
MKFYDTIMAMKRLLAFLGILTFLGVSAVAAPTQVSASSIDTSKNTVCDGVGSADGSLAWW